MPRLPILFILWHGAAQADRSHPANRLLGNDVPRVLQYRVGRNKIERSRTVLLIIALEITDISFRAGLLCDRAFHLHCHKLPRTTNHAIKPSRVAKRLAYLQTALRRPRHKHRLRPLPSFLIVSNNFRLPFIHPRLLHYFVGCSRAAAADCSPRRKPWEMPKADCPREDELRESSRQQPTGLET